MNCGSVPFTCSRRAKTAISLLLAAALTAGFVAGAAAQQEPKPNVAAPQSVLSVPERFAADLKILAQRMKVTFVVEGQPIGTHAAVMPDTLQAALAGKGVVEEKIVKELAEFYDYSFARRGNVFVLTKLYTDPNDLPDVTQEECCSAVKSALQTITSFNPRIPPEDRFGNRKANIVHMLTPEQADALSRSGLAVSSLSAAQREEAWRLALYYYVQT